MATKTRKTARGPLWTAVTKRWTIRALVAITVGLAIGAAGGAYTVHTFEPGRPDAVDSLQTMLDSMSRGTLKKPAVAPAPEPDPVATGEASPPSMLPVPDLIGMEEGAARNAILDAGFEVGAITFRPSPQPPGTVLSSTPVAGGQLAFGGEVALVLSDGRGAGDSLLNSDFLPAP